MTPARAAGAASTGRRGTAIGLTAVAALACGLTGCGRKQTELGEGGSIVTGSAGPAGAHNASHELLKCDAPVATMALVENPNGYVLTGSYNLPSSPLPLVRLIAQQSGCFRVVDRSSGLKATVQEQELQDAGILRKNTTVHKGQGYEAQYTITPSLTFSERDAGREIGGILGMAGLVLGRSGGAAGAGWSNSNEGKVIAAAFLDAHNQLVAQLRALQAKELPPAVAVKAHG